MAELLTVHDPRGYPPKVVGKRLAARPESLDGKLVYLVDCLFDNSENFMRELQDWFGKNLPRVKTRLIQPPQKRERREQPPVGCRRAPALSAARPKGSPSRHRSPARAASRSRAP